MPQELRSIHKIGLNAAGAAGADNAAVDAGPPAAPTVVADAVTFATLQLRVTKNGGPVATFVEVGSSGSDDQVFNDSQLDPGPAQKPLLQGNFYTVVWRGAFVAPGNATLHLRMTRADGTVLVQEDVPVSHPPTNSPFTIVVL